MITLICNTSLIQSSQVTKTYSGNSKPANDYHSKNNDKPQNNQKSNRDKALLDGSLILHKGKEYKIFGFSIYKTNDEYEYIADGKETIGYIKNKFGIKDGKIKELNPYIKDDNYQPQRGKSIYLPADAFMD